MRLSNRDTVCFGTIFLISVPVNADLHLTHSSAFGKLIMLHAGHFLFI
jgi:hypothetical protein